MPSASRKEPAAERAIIPTAASGNCDALLARHPAQHAGDLLERRAVEVEAVAAVDDRGRHLVRLGGGEHEDDVRRRLLQRLQERVPRRGREHVRLVEDVDAARARPSGRARRSRAARGCRRPSCSRRRPSRPRRARCRSRWPGRRGRPGEKSIARAAVGVQRAGQELGHRGLAGAARADEQVGVVHLPELDRVAQRADDVLLADHLVERPGAVTAVQREHRRRIVVAHPVASRAGRGRFPVRAPSSVRAREERSRVADRPAGDPGDRRRGGARLRPRLPQLRHLLRARVGQRPGRGAPAPVRRARRAHAASAGDRRRRGGLAARRGGRGACCWPSGSLGLGAFAVGLFRLGQSAYAWPVGAAGRADRAHARALPSTTASAATSTSRRSRSSTWAAVLEARRPRRGAPVLVLLGARRPAAPGGVALRGRVLAVARAGPSRRRPARARRAGRRGARALGARATCW